MQRHPGELAARWLQQAQDDVAAIDVLVADGRHNIVCFLAQQGAGHASKAALVWENGDFPRIHLIRELLAELAATRLILSDELRSNALTLDKYYLTTRYPDVLDYAQPSQSFSKEEAEMARAIALGLIDAVEGHLRASGAIS